MAECRMMWGLSPVHQVVERLMVSRQMVSGLSPDHEVEVLVVDSQSMQRLVVDHQAMQGLLVGHQVGSYVFLFRCLKLRLTSLKDHINEFILRHPYLCQSKFTAPVWEICLWKIFLPSLVRNCGKSSVPCVSSKLCCICLVGPGVLPCDKPHGDVTRQMHSSGFWVVYQCGMIDYEEWLS